MPLPAIELVVRGRRVRPHGRPEGPASVHVAGGKIAAVSRFEDVPSGASVLEAGDLVVLPGMVDAHVHVNEPGRTEWEGWASASRAAAAGGVTTVVEMPLNAIPATTDVPALEAKVAAARRSSIIDFGLWGGIVPGNEAHLVPLLEAGVLGFKCFLVPSGVDEFRHVGEAELRRAFEALRGRTAPVLAHCEVPGPIDEAAKEREARAARGKPADPRSHAEWLRSRPERAEKDAIALLLALSEEYRIPVHIVHLSAASALRAISGARRRGVPLTVETCPHYLLFAAEEVPDGATEYKCAPPIRERANNEKLFAALESGAIEMVASDHSPAPPEVKKRESGDFFQAWGGIASLQLTLAAMHTELRRRGYPEGFALERLEWWFSGFPSRMAGIEGRKGRIAAGRDADLVLFDPDARWTVDAARLEHRHKMTPYHGREMRGRVVKTLVRGRLVYDDGRFPGADAPGGDWVKPDPPLDRLRTRPASA
jgi:allantoinase